MKVFISWSGQSSGNVAAALRDWLPAINQSADFWVSRKDIGSGDRWFSEIGKQLDETDFGIVCLTRENLTSPWLLFEAGALAKRLDVGRIAPLYIEIAPEEVEPPLKLFQGVRCDESGIGVLVRDINSLSERRVAQGSLEVLLSVMWPKLNKKLKPELERARKLTRSPEPPPSEADAMADLANAVRDMEWRLGRAIGQWETCLFPPSAFRRYIHTPWVPPGELVEPQSAIGDSGEVGLENPPSQ